MNVIQANQRVESAKATLHGLAERAHWVRAALKIAGCEADVTEPQQLETALCLVNCAGYLAEELERDLERLAGDLAGCGVQVSAPVAEGGV